MAPVSGPSSRRPPEGSRVGPAWSQGPGGLHVLPPNEILDGHPAGMQACHPVLKTAGRVLLRPGERHDDATAARAAGACHCAGVRTCHCAGVAGAPGAQAPWLLIGRGSAAARRERAPGAILRRRREGPGPRDHTPSAPPPRRNDVRLELPEHVRRTPNPGAPASSVPGGPTSQRRAGHQRLCDGTLRPFARWVIWPGGVGD